MSDLRKTVAYGVYALAGLGAIVGTSLGKMYAPAFAAALGFIAPIPADLTPEQQKRLERADSRVSSAFLTDAQIALRDSPLYVADLGDAAIAGVHYAGDRIIARSSFENSSIDRIVFHESMHHLFKRGLIDATAFDLLLGLKPCPSGNSSA